MQTELEKALAVLDQHTPERVAVKFLNIGAANTEIRRLRAALGMKVAPPIWNVHEAAKQISVLETALSTRGTTPPPVALPAVLPAIAAALPAAVETVVDLNAPLSTTAAGYVRMTGLERQSFCESAGAMLKSEFDQLTAANKSKFCLQGGRIVDSLTPPEPVTPAAPGATSVTRAQFDLFSPEARMAYIKAGNRITN